MNAFPDNLNNGKNKERILFRIDQRSNQPNPSVLIQSSIVPNWAFLLNKNQYLSQDPVFKQFNYPKFTKGSILWFRLFGNITKKVKGKRVGMYNEEEQFKWLKRKAEQGGFRLLQINIVKKKDLTAKIKKNSKSMTFFGVQFEGIIEIIEPIKFENSLKEGIGSGKAFGFGLLSIAPVKSKV